MRQRTVPVWRHWTLQGTILAIVIVLVIRLIEIQIFRHDEYLDKAEKQWKSRQELPPERGNLYDRQGRPLALSVTCWRVGVATCQVTNADALVESLTTILPEQLGGRGAALRRLIARGDDQHVVVITDAVLSVRQRTALRRLEPPLTVQRRSSRVYPLGGVGASLIGFFRPDGEEGTVATGLEQGLDGLLAGTPGEAWRLESAVPGRSLGNIVLQPPRHGQNLVLTIDADLQTLAEERLAHSISTCGAAGGTVLIVDPRQGDILAAASWPLLADRREPGEDPGVWNNFNFTGIYEPGSVFKLFTTASLLGNGAIDTAMTFDCTNGDFGCYRIHNCEPDDYGPLPLLTALSKSINIYFARAVLNLGRSEFFRDLTEFGFGQRTRCPYPAQAAGILNHPSLWSGRSLSTIAIGQEVAVTPLQLVMATCAIANGGYLFAPRMVRQIRGQDEQLVEECPPVPLRRVMSEQLARLLQHGMQRVVTEGTGSAAALPWIDTGGKTGTAQKSLDGRTYAPGKFVASFVGCVPVAEPRLVILTLLDEPDYAHHWAAESAAPLFADLVGDIRRTTRWLTDLVSAEGLATVNSTPRPQVEVPDVLYLSIAAAEDEIRRAGLVLQGGANGGLVVEQVPAAGALCTAGGHVRVTVAATRPAVVGAASVCPDLRGLSNREVLSLAARMGVSVEVAGAGYVARQEPAAGDALGPDGIRVRMEAPWQ